MEPDAFYRRWAEHLDPRWREQFMLELAALMAAEQARERRRLCTDAEEYRMACEKTAAEINGYMVDSAAA